MPYIVNFTDKDNKSPITVFDNTSSTDTSLIFPGRNVTGYGQIIAENFLHLLENFSSTTAPVNPVEGQLWYDSTNSVLQIWDNTNWKAASGIQKGPTEPAVQDSKIGELWVDTTNQQLRIYTGSRWILVGPSESSIDGLRYGPAVEKIFDSDNVERSILTFYIADVPVIVFSKDSFTPKVGIDGYTSIRAGMNLNVPANTTQIDQFIGGLLPKLYGTAETADALNVAGESVPVLAAKFLRSDAPNTTEYGINVRSNSGITLGVDGTFNISNSATAAKIYNSAVGSSLDLQTNRNGTPSTILRIIDNKVGINKASPDEALDVDGNIGLTGSLIVTDTTESTNLNNGSIRTAGGIAVTKNIIVGTSLTVSGTTQVTTLQPNTTDTYDNGTSSKRWKTVRAKTVIADEIQGVLSGNIIGNANTATSLKNVTTFQLAGDVISGPVQFDGQVGSYSKVFNASLTSNIISSKSEPFPNYSKSTDYVLVFRPSLAAASAVTATVAAGSFVTGTTYTIATLGSTNFTAIGAASNTVGIGFVATGPGAGTGTATTTTSSQGLIKETRDVFVGDLGVPIGAIMPYAGSNAPYGYLFCDGSEIERAKFPELYDVIGTTYSKTLFAAGTLVTGQTYTIEYQGSTSWVAIGSSSNSVGTVFVATGPGSGTGTASTTSFIGVNTFRLPDLRGRFALGKDNMDNNGTVPTATGGYVDAGGGNIDRVPDTKADILGGDAGQSSVTLTLGNLPDHEHSLQNGTTQFSAVRIDTALSPPASPGLGPTAPSQAQYLNTSGFIKKPDPSFTLSTPVGIMNPYLTVNYIIRSGPPAFTTSA